MSRWKRTVLLSIEALICFGPIGFVLLLGMLVSPFWATALVAHFSGVIQLDPDEGTVWDLLWPMVVVVCGAIGLVGLVRVIVLLSMQPREPSGRRLTLAMVVIGIAGLLLFHLAGGGFPPLEIEAIPAYLVYWVLPGAGIAHFLYLARHLLFPRRRRITSSCSGP